MTEPSAPSQVDELLGARPRSRVRRWVSLGILLLALAVAAMLLLRFLEGNDTPYYMAPVVRADLRPHLALTGTLHLAGEIGVRAPQDAMIAALPAGVGSTVEQGQAVAVVDVSHAASTIAADRSALAAARDAVAHAGVTRKAAAARLARYEKVWQESGHRVPSLDELEGARAEAMRAAIALRRDRVLADAAKQRLHADLARLDAALPRAPFAAVVTQLLVAPGSRVQAGQPIVDIAPRGAQARVVVLLSRGIGPLPAGMHASVLIDGSGDVQHPATLLRVDTDASGQRSAVFGLAPDPGIAPRASVTVRLTLPVRHRVLVVPNAALAFAPHCTSDHSHTSICLLARDGTARSVDIVAGPSDGRNTQVLAGSVRPGQLAIIGWREAPAASSPELQRPASSASPAAAASS